MARVYLTTNSRSQEVGLFLRHDPDTPYAVTVDGRIVAVIDNLRDAYIFYNDKAR